MYRRNEFSDHLTDNTCILLCVNDAIDGVPFAPNVRASQHPWIANH